MPCVSGVVVVNVVTPAESVPVPICVVPSRNVTVPAIVPAVLDVTVAVNVTFVAVVDGFGDDVSAVEVAAVVGGVTADLLRKITLPTTMSGLPSSFKSVASAPPFETG